MKVFFGSRPPLMANVMCLFLIAVIMNHFCLCTDGKITREKRTIHRDDTVHLGSDDFGLDTAKRQPNVTNARPTTVVSTPVLKPNPAVNSTKSQVTPPVGKPNFTLSGHKPNITLPPTQLSSNTGKNRSSTTIKPWIPVITATTPAPKNITTTKVPKHEKVTTQHSNVAIFATTIRPAPSTTTEAPLGTYWDGWKELLTSKYWRKRYKDHQYLLQLSLPIAIGIGVAAVIALIVCIGRCMCALKRSRRTKRNKKMFFDKDGSDKWMLLEKASSSDEDAV